jgi:polyvinyl alcohol dehydrogenase (cytochrome)
MRRDSIALVGAGALLLCSAASMAGDNPCSSPSAQVVVGAAQWNGWGQDLENSRYQPEPAIRASDVPKLAVKWAFGLGGDSSVGQPTIVDGRLFVTGATGRVYSLDAKTGCTFWAFDAAASSRTAISIGELAALRPAPQPKPSRRSRRSARKPAHVEWTKAPSAAFFGDDSGAVYALDAQKGTLLWKTQADTHPSARIAGSPILYQDRLYVPVATSERAEPAQAGAVCCTFRGSVVALDIATGRVVWRTFTIAEGSQAAGAAIESAPTVDVKRGLLYVGTGKSYSGADAPPGAEVPLAGAVVALALKDGAVMWSKPMARAGDVGGGFSSSPILRNLANGHQILVAESQSAVVHGLDPDHGGDILWQTKANESDPSAGLSWGPAADHRVLYVGSNGLTAIELKSGVKRWYAEALTPACSWGAEACAHAQSQAITVMPGIAFSGAVDGHLRAYSTIGGKTVWDFDTAKEYPTVNLVKAGGGSLDHGGPTIVNGIVYVNSGNALIALSVGGK